MDIPKESITVPQRLVFVPTDRSARIRSPERQLIRQHCMKQKNKLPGSRRSMREAAARARATKGSLSEAEKQNEDSISGSQPISSRARPQSSSRSNLSAGKGAKQAQDENFISENAIPVAPPSDWALFEFPEILDVSSQKLMHQCFIHNPIRDPLCPFKLFGIKLDFDQDSLWCFRLLISEKLCFHAMLLLNSASNDWMLQRPLSSDTYCHLRRTLPILNSRLALRNAYKDDILLYVIGILASIAVLFGDYKAARTHATGLSEIIRLRGGFDALKQSNVIKLAMDRLNFSSVLVTDLWTPIYDGSIWKEPAFPAEILTIYHSAGTVCIDGLVDVDLAAAFRILQCTTILLNKHFHSQTPIDGAFLQQCLGFVHSSLIRMKGQLKNKMFECCRLGMMTFLATTFRLPHLNTQPYCKDLTNKLLHLYFVTKDSNAILQNTIDIWLIFICLISGNSIGKQYLQASWKAVYRLSWDETRTLLKQVMWIDTFHDNLGKRAFEELVNI